MKPISRKDLSDMQRQLDSMVLKSAKMIMAEEDRLILEALDNVFPTCRNREHTGYGEPVINCDHPECIARSVHES